MLFNFLFGEEEGLTVVVVEVVEVVGVFVVAFVELVVLGPMGALWTNGEGRGRNCGLEGDGFTVFGFMYTGEAGGLGLSLEGLVAAEELSRAPKIGLKGV